MKELIAYDPAQLSGPSDSARGPIVTGLIVLVAFFAGLGGWAAYAPLNGAVVAQAVVKVEGNRKSIQHLDGGIVKQLLVGEGQYVEAGQTVVVLDDTQARAMVLMLSQQYDVYRAEQARLRTGVTGGLIVGPEQASPQTVLARCCGHQAETGYRSNTQDAFHGLASLPLQLPRISAQVL